MWHEKRRKSCIMFPAAMKFHHMGAVQERYKVIPFLNVLSCSLQGIAERPLPCNYYVIQLVCALSRR